MSNKRITDLTELTTPTTDDVFPVVDIATNTTTKVQLGNLPVPTSVTTALATKQDTLVSGTNIKTVNSTSLVGSGNVAVQPTLVSGTNIKTLNSTSLLGSGDIVLTANPSGVAGAIQFSNGSAFASDASNLFWDDTNNRLGVGTNAPSGSLQIVDDNINQTILGIKTSQSASTFRIVNGNSAATPVWNIGVDSPDTRLIMYNSITFRANGTSIAEITSSEVRIGSITGARLGIKGSGSTSATTSLLVQNSAGSTLLSVRDDKVTDFNAGTILNVGTLYSNAAAIGFINSSGNAFSVMRTNNSTGNATFDYSVSIGTTSAPNSSAALDITSTTKGFLPPRMTTTQKNAIATPVAGLVVYDSTTNKLCCYNGSTWNDLF